MTTWTLQPQRKKSIKEVIYWHRDGVTISLEEWFRWGTWKCESETKPVVDLDNPDGYDVYAADAEWELIDMSDGQGYEWEFPDGVSEEDQDAIQEAYDDGGFDALEEMGWEHMETETFIHGPLILAQESD